MSGVADLCKSVGKHGFSNTVDKVDLADLDIAFDQMVADA